MSFLLLEFLAALSLVVSASAHPVGSSGHTDHVHVESGGLPGSWHHDNGHHTERLFRRQSSNPLPVVGSAEWTAKYPPALTPIDETRIPGEWLAAYDAVSKAGLIPQIPPPTSSDAGLVYAQGFDPKSPEVCGTQVQCYNATDIHEAPAGVIGISFDDGPTTDGSPELYKWLGQNHVQATHFMIGGNILSNPKLFLQAFRMNADLAVHTWTHPSMPTLSDHAIVAELGWTMQIIYDSTGGRVPKYWRPPMGEMDQRVRAIAERVFGLTAVMWNRDTNDWGIPATQTLDALATQMEGWLSGPKAPGIVLLSHELNQDTVGAFLNITWPGIKKYGWRAGGTAAIFAPKKFNYQNAKDNVGAVAEVKGILPADWANAGPPDTGATTTSTGSSSSSTTAPPANSQGPIGPTTPPGTQPSAPSAPSDPHPTQSVPIAPINAGAGSKPSGGLSHADAPAPDAATTLHAASTVLASVAVVAVSMLLFA